MTRWAARGVGTRALGATAMAAADSPLWQTWFQLLVSAIHHWVAGSEGLSPFSINARAMRSRSAPLSPS